MNLLFLQLEPCLSELVAPPPYTLERFAVEVRKVADELERTASVVNALDSDLLGKGGYQTISFGQNTITLRTIKD